MTLAPAPDPEDLDPVGDPDARSYTYRLPLVRLDDDTATFASDLDDADRTTAPTAVLSMPKEHWATTGRLGIVQFTVGPPSDLDTCPGGC